MPTHQAGVGPTLSRWAGLVDNGSVAQISRPIRPVLIVTIVFAAVWFVTAMAPGLAGVAHAVGPESGSRPVGGSTGYTAVARDLRLSDEFTRTRWASADILATARAGAAASARPVARLRFYTEDGYTEVYILLRRHFDRHGVAWVEVRLPGRPNGRVGWVRRSALGSVRTVHTALRVDRHRLRATFFRDGHRVWSARVGVGKAGTQTPAGRYWIRERFAVPGRSLYGPYAFGTSAYSRLSDWPRGGVVGIHGTDQPGLIPGRPSHGCIRMRNRDIRWLARSGRLLIGTPVRIL